MRAARRRVRFPGIIAPPADDALPGGAAVTAAFRRDRTPALNPSPSRIPVFRFKIGVLSQLMDTTSVGGTHSGPGRSPPPTTQPPLGWCCAGGLRLHVRPRLLRLWRADLMTADQSTVTEAISAPEIEEALLAFLADQIKTSVAADQDLFGSGLVSSMFAMQLVVHLEETYDIAIVGSELKLDNFRTVHRMTELVLRLREQEEVAGGA
jgi:methoxymalonate biosynthesis acyl carrier protein